MRVIRVDFMFRCPLVDCQASSSSSERLPRSASEAYRGGAAASATVASAARSVAHSVVFSSDTSSTDVDGMHPSPAAARLPDEGLSLNLTPLNLPSHSDRGANAASASSAASTPAAEATGAESATAAAHPRSLPPKVSDRDHAMAAERECSGNEQDGIDVRVLGQCCACEQCDRRRFCVAP
jgi:hypothetical protein